MSLHWGSNLTASGVELLGSSLAQLPLCHLTPIRGGSMSICCYRFGSRHSRLSSTSWISPHFVLHSFSFPSTFSFGLCPSSWRRCSYPWKKSLKRNQEQLWLGQLEVSAPTPAQSRVMSELAQAAQGLVLSHFLTSPRKENFTASLVLVFDQALHDCFFSYVQLPSPLLQHVPVVSCAFTVPL